jgi:hypothetical protein
MIEFDKTYSFKIENVGFGCLSLEEIIDILKDGRVASHFLERMLEKWFPELEFVDGNGYDHVNKGNQVKYDQKCFTKGGCGFAKSILVGGGRTFDLSEATKHSAEMNYILCDIVEFPEVRVVFAEGKNLLTRYPKCKIPFKDRELIFKVA